MAFTETTQLLDAFDKQVCILLMRLTETGTVRDRTQTQTALFLNLSKCVELFDTITFVFTHAIGSARLSAFRVQAKPCRKALAVSTTNSRGCCWRNNRSLLLRKQLVKLVRLHLQPHPELSVGQACNGFFELHG